MQMQESDAKTKVANAFGKYPSRTYKTGQTLIFGGEEPDHVFYIESGIIKKYDVSYRGDEVIINMFKTGAFFPMSWAINKTPNTYFYAACETTTVHVIPPEVAVQFLKDNPDVMFDLLGRIYSGLDGMFGRMVKLMSGTAKSRGMYELIVDAKRFGTLQHDGSCDLHLHESDIASRSGLSRETVSREISKLKKSGLVAVKGRYLTIGELTDFQRQLGLAV